MQKDDGQLWELSKAVLCAGCSMIILETWSHAVISSLGARARGGGGQALAFRVARCRTRSLVDIRLGPVGSRQGSPVLVGDPYGSVSQSYTDTGPSNLPSGLVRGRRTISAEVGFRRISVGSRFGTTGPVRA